MEEVEEGEKRMWERVKEPESAANNSHVRVFGWSESEKVSEENVTEEPAIVKRASEDEGEEEEMLLTLFTVEVVDMPVNTKEESVEEKKRVGWSSGGCVVSVRVNWEKEELYWVNAEWMEGQGRSIHPQEGSGVGMSEM